MISSLSPQDHSTYIPPILEDIYSGVIGRWSSCSPPPRRVGSWSCGSCGSGAPRAILLLARLGPWILGRRTSSSSAAHRRSGTALGAREVGPRLRSVAGLCRGVTHAGGARSEPQPPLPPAGCRRRTAPSSRPCHRRLSPECERRLFRTPSSGG